LSTPSANSTSPEKPKPGKPRQFQRFPQTRLRPPVLFCLISAVRSQFLGQKRGAATAKGGSTPKGGGFIHESQRSMLQFGPVDISAHIAATMNKSFDALTDDDFEALHDYFTSPAGALYAGMLMKFGFPATC
jgi:hypothetical protein